MEQTLAQSQGTTDQLCSLLDDFVERTAALQAVMLPIHARIQSLTRVQDNAKLASSLCESMLLHFDVSRDVERQVRSSATRWQTVQSCSCVGLFTSFEWLGFRFHECLSGRWIVQVMEGPRGDLEAYIRTLDKLDAAVSPPPRPQTRAPGVCSEWRDSHNSPGLVGKPFVVPA